MTNNYKYKIHYIDEEGFLIKENGECNSIVEVISKYEQRDISITEFDMSIIKI